MRTLLFAAAAASILTVATAGGAYAAEGGSGGDREPAGGAFNSSYLAPGTTGIQDHGPPRSVDIPRGRSRYPDETESTGSDQPYRRRVR